MTVSKNGVTKHYFAESERILANVFTGGRPLVKPDTMLSCIKFVQNAIDFSAIFTNFAQVYFHKYANYDGCIENRIEYPAEMRNLPPLHKIYYKAIDAGRSDKLYYFNANHLGSGSLITDGNGQTYQTLAYTPYGSQLVDIKHYSDIYNEPYRFGGKIKDEESGLNYFEARYYWNDGSIPISTDPHWYNYPHITSYNWCGQNPIMFIDPDGRDIIVLLAPKGANGAGHMGILIGNDKDGWTYMSKDGANNLIGLFGESNFNRTTFSNFEKFLISDEIKREENGNGAPYTQGLYFKTSADQDNTATAAMEKAGKEYYNVFTNNCADAVGEALKSVNIDPGYDENGDMPLIPNTQFSNISKNNEASTLPVRPQEQQTPRTDTTPRPNAKLCEVEQ